MDNWEKKFTDLFYRSDCPDVTELRDYQFEVLDNDVRSKIDIHLKACPHCEAELAELMAVPEPAMLTVDIKPKQIGLRERLKTIVATMSELSGGTQVAFRSGENAEPPQSFWFDAEGTFINLEWRPDDHGRYRVYGQLLGAVEDSQLMLTDTTVMISTEPRQISVDADGSFLVEAVEGGTYQLTIRSAEQQIVIPAVTISQLPPGG